VIIASLPIDPVVLISSVTLQKRASMFEVVNEGQQVTSVASQSVQLPHHDLIAVAQISEDRVELEPTGHGATHPVVSEIQLQPAAFNAACYKSAVWSRGVNPGVPDTSHPDVPHQRPPSSLLKLAHMRHIAKTKPEGGSGADTGLPQLPTLTSEQGILLKRRADAGGSFFFPLNRYSAIAFFLLGQRLSNLDFHVPSYLAGW
jgi:hypothetical protein